MTGPTSSRRSGRPRDPATDVAILTGTLAVLARDGYGGLSMDGVAAEAGVGRATIYRRWASKKDLIIAAAQHLSQTVPSPDTGDLRGDLDAITAELARLFAAPTTDRLVAALISAMADDPQLATALRDGFFSVRRDALRAVLDRALGRGEIASDVDLDVAIDLLAAPLHYRLLVTGQEIDDRFAGHLVDAVVAWIRQAD